MSHMIPNKLIAYHGDPAIKETYLERMRAHVAADELIHGIGWANGKGCAVGCTLDRYDHAAYEEELGIPQTIAHLEDAIFEGLPNEISMGFPLRFLTAIKPGADLSLVIARFMVWLLGDPDDGVIRFCSDYPQARSAIDLVVSLYRRVIAGDIPTDAEWNSAAMAAMAAEAAMAAAWAAWAARAAAWAAEAAAAWAARAAAWAAGYQKMADKLIELLEAA